MNAFFAALNSATSTASAMTGESWRWNGTEFDAISIEDLDYTTTATAGGVFRDVTTNVFVLKTVWKESGATKGAVIEVPRSAAGDPTWTRVRVLALNDGGGDDITLHCGSTASKVTL